MLEEMATLMSAYSLLQQSCKFRCDAFPEVLKRNLSLCPFGSYVPKMFVYLYANTLSASGILDRIERHLNFQKVTHI